MDSDERKVIVALLSQTSLAATVLSDVALGGASAMVKIAHFSRTAKKLYGTCVMVIIDHFAVLPMRHYAVMKTKKEQALTVRCPTCGARPGQKCELSTGLPRTEPHRDRRLRASDKQG